VITLAPKHLPIIATAAASLHRTIVNSRGWNLPGKGEMSTAIETKDVVVVGAGVVGLAAALGWRTQDCRSHWLDRHRTCSRGPLPCRSTSVSTRFAPASVELLTRLRVWPKVDTTRTQAVARMRVFGDAGDELAFNAYGAAVERLATIGEEAELLARALHRMRLCRRPGARNRAIRFDAYRR